MPQLQDAVGGEVCRSTGREEGERVSRHLVRVLFLVRAIVNYTDIVIEPRHAYLHFCRQRTVFGERCRSCASFRS